MDGFYRMARGWMDHHIFANDPLTEREAWQWLIEHAAFAPHPHRVGQNVVPVERGQLAVSTRYLAQAWQWSKSRVARFLKKLKTGTMIGTVTGTESGTGYTLVTICNYDKYQGVQSNGGTASGTPDGTASGTNYKEGLRKKDSEINDLSARQFDGFWRLYPSRRPHSNPRKPARLKFEAALKRGVPASNIIRGAENYAVYVERETTDPRFIAQAVTWLNQERWTEYQEAPEEARPEVAPL